MFSSALRFVVLPSVLRCWYVADVSSGDQLWEDENSLLGPSLECLSTITHHAFLCVNIKAREGVGGAGRQCFSCFDDIADLESSPNRALKVIETQSFCFLLDFQNFFQEEEGGKNQESLERFIKVLQISKQHLWCQSKGLWMKKPRYAVNSSENTLDKAAIHAKSVPQSDPINRKTTCNH